MESVDCGSSDPETYAVIGAAMAVHRELRHGFLEIVYRDALEVELADRQIPFEREKPLSVFYKGALLRSSYRVDFLCFGHLLVECKALGAIGGGEQAQVINYLRASGHTRALLLNFGTRSLEYRRLVMHPQPYPQIPANLHRPE